jgi:hypothetical protein
MTRGDVVTVREPGRQEWAGTVLTVKPSGKTVYVEVRDPMDRMVWSVPIVYVVERVP